MKYYKYVGVALLVLCFATNAFAETVSTTSRPVMKDGRKLEIKNDMRISSTTGPRCDLVEKRLLERKNNFETRKVNHDNRYTELKIKLSNLVSILKKEGKDTTKLETDIATLNIKIAKFNTDMATVETKLATVKTFVCGKSNGEFKNALTEVDTARKVVLADMKDIKNFIETTIKADVVSFRSAKDMKNKESATSSLKLKAKVEPLQ